ncbi:hypothetical protein J6590_070501 [Homalodisca vitripennis]|nr:hypothetical protein J6590_070501 [Homalodisca vitripennis]
MSYLRSEGVENTKITITLDVVAACSYDDSTQLVGLPGTFMNSFRMVAALYTHKNTPGHYTRTVHYARLSPTATNVNILYWCREKRRDLARAGAQLCTSVLPRGNFRRFAPQPTLRIVYPSNGVICFQ